MYRLRRFWCHLMVKMVRIIEFVDGLELKFWWVLSAIKLETILTMQNSTNRLKLRILMRIVVTMVVSDREFEFDYGK